MALIRGPSPGGSQQVLLLQTLLLTFALIDGIGLA